MADALLEVHGLGKRFRDRGRRRSATHVDAVQDLTFAVPAGGALAIVGESGSGKTTTARMILGLEQPSSGTMSFDGVPLSARPSGRERRERARKIQIVFQNPYVSLDPRQTPLAVVEEVLRFHFDLAPAARRSRAVSLLESVGLGEREIRSRPHRLSGGQNQRVAIARALAAEPRLLVLDEAVSALDVSVQAQILNLLQSLRRDFEISYLFISHNLGVVRQVCDDVLVMYRGSAVETGPVEQVLTAPAHPYTQKLIASVPAPGAVWTPSPIPAEDPVDGCRFRNRCPHAFDRCTEQPPLIAVGAAQTSRCWLAAPA